MLKFNLLVTTLRKQIKKISKYQTDTHFFSKYADMKFISLRWAMFRMGNHRDFGLVWWLNKMLVEHFVWTRFGKLHYLLFVGWFVFLDMISMRHTDLFNVKLEYLFTRFKCLYVFVCAENVFLLLFFSSPDCCVLCQNDSLIYCSCHLVYHSNATWQIVIHSECKCESLFQLNRGDRWEFWKGQLKQCHLWDVFIAVLLFDSNMIFQVSSCDKTRNIFDFLVKLQSVAIKETNNDNVDKSI